MSDLSGAPESTAFAGDYKMISALDKFEQEWETLYRHSSNRSIFNSFPYVSLWYRTFASEDQIYVVRAVDDNETVALLPLVRSRHSFATHLTGLINPQCRLSGPLVRQGYETTAANLLLKSLLENKETGWDILEQGPIYSFEQPGHLLTGDALQSAGRPFCDYAQPTYLIDLTIPYAEYLRQGLGKKYAGNLKNRSNRLKKAGHSEFLHLRDHEAVEHLDEFLVIEDSGWKGERGSSVLQRGERLQGFYKEFARLLADQRALHLFFLTLDDIKIAGRLVIADGSVVHFYKTGYREDYHAYSPSSLLLAHTLEWLMDGKTEFRLGHLFPDNDRHKSRWSNLPGTASQVIVYNDTIRGRVALTSNAIRQKLKGIGLLRAAVTRMRSLTGR